MIGFIYAILSAISFSTNNIFLKKSGQKLNATLSLILVYIFVSIISFIITIFFGDYSHIFNLKFFILTFFVGLFGAIGIITFLKSFEKLSVAKTLAISNFYPFITLFLYFIIFNEKIVFSNLLFMIIVFFGIILTINESKKIKFEKHLYYPIIAALSWGFYFLFLDLLSKENISSINVLFYGELSIFLNIILFYLIFLRKKVKFDISKFKSKTLLINTFLAGFFAVFGVLFFILSIKTIQTSISASILSSQVIFSSIFAYLFFKEKLNKKQIIGIFIVFLGLVSFQLF